MRGFVRVGVMGAGGAVCGDWGGESGGGGRGPAPRGTAPCFLPLVPLQEPHQQNDNTDSQTASTQTNKQTKTNQRTKDEDR